MPGFYIQSYQVPGNLVIDYGVGTGSGAPRLYANTKNGSASQLWTIVPSPANPNFALIQNTTSLLVIDLHPELPLGSIPPRRPLDAFEMKKIGPDNQLWVFWPTGIGLLPVTETYYYIQSAHFPDAASTTKNLAIEIDNDATAVPLGALDAVPPNFPADNQLWILVDSASGLPVDPSTFGIPVPPPF